ncbi:MAG: hypothetical protein JST00_19075 [Deltaproteobacteria bacterium]|nr:hypothetical protein [Deltaproteobacteria bacterium]
MASLVTIGASTSAVPARADNVEACVKESYRGQKARDEGQLVVARDALSQCSAGTCPSIVVRDCAKWLADVEERLPTVIVSARDARGRDAVATKVFVDGRLTQSSLDGRAFALDPGPHVFRFESGSATTSRTILVREREKGRVIHIDLPSQDAMRAPEPRTTTSSGPPPIFWVFSGVAVAGFVGFGAFYASGVSKRDELRDTCAGACTSDQVGEVRTLSTLSVVSASIGAAGAVAAVLSWLLHNPDPAPSSP